MDGFTHESSYNESIEWYTPPVIFAALGLTFDLDPCSPGEGKSFVPARKHYTVADNGLAQQWEGTVWVNPPYGQFHTPRWMLRLAAHGDGLGLTFARTDTRWFQEIAPQASGICFIAERVLFYQGDITRPPPGRPGAGSMLMAFGSVATEALEQSGLGVVVALAARDSGPDLFSEPAA